MPSNKKTGLGKGFESLIPQGFDRSLLIDDQEKIQKVELSNLEPNPNQPRTLFDEKSLNELAESIKEHGIIQPLVVTPIKGGKATIIAGERRWRAAKIAGLVKVPVIMRSSKELEQLEIALIENVQRVDLAPLEQAISIEYLHQQFSLSYEVIAKRLGKASSTVNNIVRLLQLPDSAKESLRNNKITEGHARAILSVKSFPGKQEELLEQIISNGWSVRQAERFAVSLKEGYQDPKETKKRMQTVTPLTEKLSHRIGAPVSIRRLAKGGKLEISFGSDEELEKIMGLLS